MPCVIATVSRGLDPGQRYAVNCAIRDAIYETAQRLDQERDRIPSPDEDFQVIIARDGHLYPEMVEITLVLLPRDDQIKELYEDGLHEALAELGYSARPKTLDAEDEDWRGSLRTHSPR